METNRRILGEGFEIALAYSHQAHSQQMRKGSNIPYIAHLLGVASIALELGADEDQAIAALLHDAVEDQGGAARLADIRARFGPQIAAIVADCTDGEPDSDRSNPSEWRSRKEAFLATLTTKSPISLLVCLADKTHNARCILDDLHEIGGSVFDRFKGGQIGTLWYYQMLAETFSRLMPGAGSQRLRTIVGEMHRLASAGAPQSSHLSKR